MAHTALLVLSSP